MFDNVYIRIVFATIAFAVCVLFISTACTYDQMVYDRIYNETASVIGEENISEIYIEDGCIHIYDVNGVLVSAGGVVNKNGVEHKYKLSLIPPFIHSGVVEINT